MAKRRKQIKKYSRRYYLITLFLVFAGIIVFAFAEISRQLIDSSFFKIRNIEINLNEDDELKKEIMRAVKDKSILTLNLESIRSKLARSHLEIKELMITKIFPHTLKVEVIERIPLFQIRSDTHYIIVDRDLVALGERSQPGKDLIVVEIDKMRRNIKKGEFINDKRVIKAGKLIEVVKEKFPAFTPEVILAKSLDSLSMVVRGTKIILGEGDFERKLKILDSLLKNKFNFNLKLLRYVDLRYSKVYLGRK